MMDNKLTAREAEVLSLISCGHSNKQIAQMLFISLYTVKNHVCSIIKKLKVKNRTDSVIYFLTQKNSSLEPAI